MIYEWDPVKGSANARKHGVRFEEATSVFLDPLALTFSDPDHSQTEDREITVGHSDKGRLIFVAHSAREGKIRTISARRVTRRESEQYEKIFRENRK